MEVTPSVTLIFTQSELLEALRDDAAAELFSECIEQGDLLDFGKVSEDGQTVTRTIVGSPAVMHQIFPSLVQAETA